MKEPTKITEDMVLCASCGKPIHISELAMIGKGLKLYHGNAFCLLDAIKDNSQEKKQNE